MKAIWLWATFMFQKRKVKLKGREGVFTWNRLEQDTLHWDTLDIINDELRINFLLWGFLKNKKPTDILQNFMQGVRRVH